MNIHYKVGELAQKTGVTVRTLHYYEDIGLITPARRNASNHRLYTETHATQLLKIKTMQQLGFELDAIKKLLTQHQPPLLELLQQRLMQATQQKDNLIMLCQQLETLLHALNQQGQVSMDQCLNTLELMNMTDNIKKHYTPEQLETLAQRQTQFSDEQLKDVEQAWNQLFADVRQAIDQGIDPSDASIKPIVDKHTELLAMFTGGDAGIEQSVSNVWQEQGEEIAQQHDMQHFDPVIFQFIDQAKKHHNA